MVIKKFDPVSCAKVAGLTYAGMGLLIGVIFTMISLAGAAFGMANDESGAIYGVLFGVGAVVIFPIFYGVMGFFGGLLTAFIYNLVAAAVGGIQVEVE